jgi:hypothetical protein
MKSILQTVDGLVQRMQPGVVVNFEPIAANNQNIIGKEGRSGGIRGKGKGKGKEVSEETCYRFIYWRRIRKEER